MAVLPRMKCPHRLEPHQIQGLDFIHIYPVIQWLVKLAIATREEMGDYIRAFSESQFSKEHITPDVSMRSTRDVCHLVLLYTHLVLSQDADFQERKGKAITSLEAIKVCFLVEWRIERVQSLML